MTGDRGPPSACSGLVLDPIVGLRVGLAVTTPRRPCLRPQIGADLALGQASCKPLEFGLLATACQRIEVVLQEGPVYLRADLFKGIREALRPLRLEVFLRRQMLRGHQQPPR